MIEFVSYKKMDKKFLSMASVIHAHLMKCEECRNKAELYQTIYDDLAKRRKTEKAKDIKEELLETVLRTTEANELER